MGVLTLNHPPVNSCNLATLEDINKALDDLEGDKNVRVIVITGGGEKAFCAGFDVSDVANSDKCRTLGQETWTRVDRLEKPVIAAINGFALGGGCELALACHFRFMTDNPKAFIGLPEVNLGITPGWGGIQRLPQVLGKSKALDIILFSKRLAPADALAIGLIDKVIPAVDLMKEATSFAAALAKRPPLAVAAVLDGMSVGMDKGFDEGLRLDQEWSAKLAASKDAVEGITAFLQKREPVFTGE